MGSKTSKVDENTFSDIEQESIRKLFIKYNEL